MSSPPRLPSLKEKGICPRMSSSTPPQVIPQWSLPILYNGIPISPGASIRADQVIRQVPKKTVSKKCKIQGCNKTKQTRGLCKFHVSQSSTYR